MCTYNAVVAHPGTLRAVSPLSTPVVLPLELRRLGGAALEPSTAATALDITYFDRSV